MIDTDPCEYYRKRILVCGGDVSRTTGLIRLIGWLRLLCVVIPLALWIWYPSVVVDILSTAVCIVLFLIGVKYHAYLFDRKICAENTIRYCKSQLCAAGLDLKGRSEGTVFIDSHHPFTSDLNVFGRNSLFSLLDSTVTSEGMRILAEWLCNPSIVADDIERRQAAVRELSGRSDFRERLASGGMMRNVYGGENSAAADIRVDQFSINIFQKIHVCLCPVVSLTAIVSALCGVIPVSVLLYILAGTLFISSIGIKTTGRLHGWLSRASSDLTAGSGVASVIETSRFESELLVDKQAMLMCDGVSASERMRQLDRCLHDLDQRYNAVGFVVLNSLFAWDWLQRWRISVWFGKNQDSLELWNAVVAYFDAMSALATFSFLHPETVYPELDEKVVICGDGLCHPLIPHEKCVANPCPALKGKSFIVLTGANMGGKSTFLRTVGVNYLLAQIGCPVFADRMRFSNAELFTSLNTSDSLADGESYFFNELKRLRRIVEDAESGKRMLILLDEVLRGTNSADKQQGSMKFLEKLIGYDVTGIIATHDLVLGTLADKFPENISTYCFEADIDGDNLTFSYKLCVGLATRLNATFLMRGMKIID